jgi:hypothetical protein
MFELTHDLEGNRYPEPETDRPRIAQMREWMDDGVAEATDGCEVEPDGVCVHGHPSWLRRLAVI